MTHSSVEAEEVVELEEVEEVKIAVTGKRMSDRVLRERQTKVATGQRMLGRYRGSIDKKQRWQRLHRWTEILGRASPDKLHHRVGRVAKQ